MSASRFADLAAVYCSVIERRSELSRDELVARTHPVIAQLYSAALELPDREPSTVETRRSTLSSQEWMALFTSLRDQLKDYDAFGPDATESRRSDEGSLADDLADIYRELRDGLAGWNNTDPTRQGDAVWDWRFGFLVHWGDHALSAMRTMHRIKCEWNVEERSHDG